MSVDLRQSEFAPDIAQAMRARAEHRWRAQKARQAACLHEDTEEIVMQQRREPIYEVCAACGTATPKGRKRA